MRVFADLHDARHADADDAPEVRRAMTHATRRSMEVVERDAGGRSGICDRGLVIIDTHQFRPKNFWEKFSCNGMTSRAAWCATYSRIGARSPDSWFDSQ